MEVLGICVAKVVDFVLTINLMFNSLYIHEVLKFVDTYQRQVGISSDNHNYLGFPTYHNKYVANIAESNDKHQ